MSALANSFKSFSFLRESIWYVGFYEDWYFGNSCFVNDWYSNSCCIQKQEREQTAPCRDNWLTTRRLMTLLGWNHFRLSKPLFFASKWFLSEGACECYLKSCHVLSFFALQVCFEKIYYTFAKEPDKLLWARLREKASPIVGKWLEHLENREVFCVHRPNFLTVSDGLGYKILREWIRCLYINVIDCLFVATSQHINDGKEQMLRLATNQLGLIRVPIVH